MEASTGLRPSHKGRGGREILGIGFAQPLTRSPLPSTELPSNSNLADPVQAYEAALWAERNAWDISRRASLNGALAGRGKLSIADADKMLRQALAALDGEALDRNPNALANYRRDGGQ